MPGIARPGAPRLGITLREIQIMAKATARKPRRTFTVGIVLYPDFDLLDVAGPYDVFNFFDGTVINRQVQVVTVAEHKAPLAASGGLHVMPSHDFRTCPPIDLLFVPVGGGPTIGAAQAAAIAATAGARIVVPMHYRTARIDFLEPVDEFLDAAARVERLGPPAFDTDALPAGDGPLVVVPAAP